IAVAYMSAAGEGLDAPYGALIDLARDIDAGRTDAYDAADRIRSWRI
ncbi:toxin Doc, partial [Streptomyces sp. NPDC055082]